MTTQQGGDEAQEVCDRFNFNILRPFYQRIKTFVDENFDTKEEITDELENMELVKKSISMYGSEFETATLNLYIWELEKINLKDHNNDDREIRSH